MTAPGSESTLDALGDLRRTHWAGEVTKDLEGQEVVLTGWVQSVRDHGGLLFVDLRDRMEIVQVVFKPDHAPECHAGPTGCTAST